MKLKFEDIEQDIVKAFEANNIGPYGELLRDIYDLPCYLESDNALPAICFLDEFGGLQFFSLFALCPHLKDRMKFIVDDTE